MLTKTHLLVILGLSVALWVSLLLLRGVPVSREMLIPFGTVVSAVSVAVFLFDRYMWHWFIFRGWFIKRPYIDGTWRAELISDWVDPSTGNRIQPIEAFLVIRQTASMISMRLYTGESRSQTVSAGIETCPDGTFEVNCVYRNKPKSAYRYRSEVHYGAMLLFADASVPKEIEGEYWTDRKTSGSVTLSQRKARKCSSYSDAVSMY